MFCTNSAFLTVLAMVSAMAVQAAATADGTMSYIVYSMYTDATCSDTENIFSATGTAFGNACNTSFHDAGMGWNSMDWGCDETDVPANGSYYTFSYNFYTSDDCSGQANHTEYQVVQAGCEASTGTGNYVLLFTRASCVNNDTPWEDGKDGVTTLFYDTNNEQCDCQDSYGMFSKLYTGVCAATAEGNSQQVTNCSSEEGVYHQKVYLNPVCQPDTPFDVNVSLAQCDTYDGSDDFSSQTQYCSADIASLCDPTIAPTASPSAAPSTASPTNAPTAAPTEEGDTVAPTHKPTHMPTHTPTQEPTTHAQKSSSSDDDSELSGGEVAGVVIGVLAGIGIIAAVGYYLVSSGIFASNGAAPDGMGDNLL